MKDILNVEIKAHCANPQMIRKILEENNARFVGIDHQIDTYFKVNKGRLKLREGNIENNLIQYHRSNQEGPKSSQISLYKSTPDSSLKQVLTNALGVLTVVDKKREIAFIDNVKFHIDDVKNLGSFVEIEAIDKNGTIGIEKLNDQCQYFMQLLEIQSDDLIAVSYSDLLMMN